eukprot:GHVU01151117.1.p1 GENE.GHVU01151117.1~~GHVU01151117.1.p1  ORF type:complete len:444 (+),score=102.72 GHVU01151117.1:444-1775(+)
MDASTLQRNALQLIDGLSSASVLSEADRATALRFWQEAAADPSGPDLALWLIGGAPGADRQTVAAGDDDSDTIPFFGYALLSEVAKAKWSSFDAAKKKEIVRQTYIHAVDGALPPSNVPPGGQQQQQLRSTRNVLKAASVLAQLCFLTPDDNVPGEVLRDLCASASRSLSNSLLLAAVARELTEYPSERMGKAPNPSQARRQARTAIEANLPTILARLLDVMRSLTGSGGQLQDPLPPSAEKTATVIADAVRALAGFGVAQHFLAEQELITFFSTLLARAGAGGAISELHMCILEVFENITRSAGTKKAAVAAAAAAAATATAVDAAYEANLRHFVSQVAGAAQSCTPIEVYDEELVRLQAGIAGLLGGLLEESRVGPSVVRVLGTGPLRLLLLNVLPKFIMSPCTVVAKEGVAAMGALLKTAASRCAEEVLTPDAVATATSE